MSPTAYYLYRPDVQTTSVVFASPHSGRDYSAGFLRQAVLDEHAVRSSEDAYVDQLYAGVPAQGASFLTAAAPRAFLDLNRAPEEMDAALVEGTRRIAHNPRVASGLGIIPRVVSNGRQIYRGKMTMAEAHSRISQYWRPYHDMLQTLLDESRRDFGEAILIDCHSMPHEALDNIGPQGAPKPEVVLGDRYGASATNAVVEQVQAIFETAGFRVVRNMPFAGAYIAQHYGRPSRQQHCVQVEIDRGLYMDERTLTPHSGFAEVQERLQGVIAGVTAMGRPDNAKLAAE